MEEFDGYRLKKKDILDIAISIPIENWDAHDNGSRLAFAADINGSEIILYGPNNGPGSYGLSCWAKKRHAQGRGIPLGVYNGLECSILSELFQKLESKV